jgi:hypothetical protein
MCMFVCESRSFGPYGVDKLNSTMPYEKTSEIFTFDPFHLSINNKKHSYDHLFFYFRLLKSYIGLFLVIFGRFNEKHIEILHVLIKFM